LREFRVAVRTSVNAHGGPPAATVGDAVWEELELVFEAHAGLRLGLTIGPHPSVTQAASLAASFKLLRDGHPLSGGSMKPTVFLVSVLIGSASMAQVQVKIDIGLPTIVFAAPPPLVVIQPGIQVVEDYDDEVFFVDGYYWCRRDARWFRTKTHQGGWVLVERGVPVTLVNLPPGQYKKWKKAMKERDRDDDGERERGKKKGKGKKGDD
jgi:hypothetical protein